MSDPTQFPSFLRPFGPAAIERIAAASSHPIHGALQFQVRAEPLVVPRRIYCRPSLLAQWADRVQGDERLLIQALATRHWDGHVRERHLRSILPFQRDWLAAFVVQLLGEYVVEIAQAILASIDELDSALYGAFVKENPGFMATTERRVVSYWNCYYRHAGYKYREEYPAMVALRAIQRMAQ